MLEELQISNFAIIEEQSVSFGKGLNVITGQTGAGKSILLQALQLIMGGKVRAHSIREGAASLEVNALLSLVDLPAVVRQELPEMLQGEEQVVVSRVVHRGGSGRVYLNGKVSTLGMIKSVVENLVDLCGQTEYVKLYDPGHQLFLLDEFGGHSQLIMQYQSAYERWRDITSRLSRAQVSEAESDRRRAELEQLVADFDAVEIGSGVRDRLEQEIRRLANGEALLELSSAMLGRMDSESGIMDQINHLAQDFRKMVQLDGAVEPLHNRFLEAWRELSEVHSAFEAYSQSVTVDQESLECLRENLAKLAFLERKYRARDEDLAALLENARADLKALNGTIDLGQLERELSQVEDELRRTAADLTKSRVRSGKRLSKLVASELKSLNMKHAELMLDISSQPWSGRGADAVELLFSSNRGYAPKALRKIASGGELSRITLVIKKILSSKHGVNVLVFDEVDTGISGEVARNVGLKLKALAQGSQVLCITHLPQVASLADTHLRVEKTEDDVTTSRVVALNRDERVIEIARMLAGSEITEASKESARELLAGNC